MVNLGSVPVPPPGIMVPPPELKKIIDRTADFVAKVGQSFETKIAQAESNNANFAFLQPLNNFHAYYQWMIRHFSTKHKSTSEVEVISKEEKAKVEAVVPSILKYKGEEIPKMMADPELQPQPRVFMLTVPQISALQLEIIKMTAQFVARNGRKFHSDLLARETKNEQFHFLRAGHFLNPFFNHLVESYTKVLLPSKQFLSELESTAKSHENDAKEKNLRKCFVRMEIDKRKKKEELEKSGKEESERLQMQLIDWNEFVVVETITFDDSKGKAEMPSAPGVPAPPPEEDDGDAEMEMEDDAEMEMDAEVEEEDTEMNIRRDHIPVYSRASATSLRTQICSICNQEIPVEEMEEHMRIELLDPRARQRRSEVKARDNKETPLALGGEVSSSLQKFAKRRTDLFGDNEELEIGRAVGEEEDELTKLNREKEKVGWDGHAGSVKVATSEASLDIHNQIAEKQKIEKEKAESVPTPGAQLPQGSQPPPRAPFFAGLLPPPPPAGGPQGSQPPGVPPNMKAPPPPAFPPAGMRPPGMMPFGGPFFGGPHGMPPMEGGMPPFMPPHLQSQKEGEREGERKGDDHPAPPPSTTEPPAKKSRTEASLESEEEWLQKYPSPVSIRVVCPSGKDEWNLKGQTLTLDVSLSVTVSGLKKILKESHIGVPPNKQKIRSDKLGFLKDNQSLASYNIGEGATLEVGVKERGGKRN
mmetsp:Transcript_17190/g.23837  ORF Transcript_17190/g.23837 Transcript_17190/m.23837 type:complete len:701 (+) Transcript_17190:888-2990(+)